MASTMSMLDSMVRKNGQSRHISPQIAMPSGRAAHQDSTAVPKPYQPGSISRHWLQLNTQGMARRSSMRCEAVREAGRLPMFSSAISAIGVEARK